MTEAITGPFGLGETRTPKSHATEYELNVTCVRTIFFLSFRVTLSFRNCFDYTSIRHALFSALTANNIFLPVRMREKKEDRGSFPSPSQTTKNTTCLTVGKQKNLSYAAHWRLGENIRERAGC